MKTKKERIPFDKLWKDVVSAFIPDFLEMFLPELHVLVDYSAKIEFLEQELKSALKDKTLKVVDKLIGLQLMDGTQRWVYVHVEFETKPPSTIGERMFGYYLRIREAFGKNVTAIVIYTGENVPKIHNKYEHTTFGTKNTYEFNTYQVREQNEEDLRNNPNPFAVIVLATLYVLQTKDDPEERLTLKEHVYEIARGRNYSEEKISGLLAFISELMLLPPLLKEKFNKYISESIKSTDMPYITDATREMADAMAKGAFGESVSELKKKVADKEIATTKIIANNELAKGKIIARLYSKQQMSIDEIAETMDLEAKDVHDVLKKQKLIKK